jgi:hypothetical protein
MKFKFNLGDILVEITNGCKKQYDSEYLGKRAIGFFLEYGDYPEILTGDEGYRYYASISMLWFRLFVSWTWGSYDIETEQAVAVADTMDTANTYSVADTKIYDKTVSAPLFPVSN